MIHISLQSVTPPSVRSKPKNSIFTVCDYCQQTSNTCNNSVREMHACNLFHLKFFNRSHRIHTIKHIYLRSATVLNTVRKSKYEIFFKLPKFFYNIFYLYHLYFHIYTLLVSCNIWREYLTQDKRLRINSVKF